MNTMTKYQLQCKKAIPISSNSITAIIPILFYGLCPSPLIRFTTCFHFKKGGKKKSWDITRNTWQWLYFGCVGLLLVEVRLRCYLFFDWIEKKN